MSTRGCVAIGTPAKWRGVYNHHSSYPTGLGNDVIREILGVMSGHNQKIKSVTMLAKTILHYDDWRAYLSGDRCKYCGRVGLGQPHSMSGAIGMTFPFNSREDVVAHYMALPTYKNRSEAEFNKIVDETWEPYEQRAKTGFPDPGIKHHSHNYKNPDEPRKHHTNKNADPLFIEWVYVINPRKMELAILSDYDTGETEEMPGKLNGQPYHHPIFGWRTAAIIKLNPFYAILKGLPSKESIKDYVDGILKQIEERELNISRMKWFLKQKPELAKDEKFQVELIALDFGILQYPTPGEINGMNKS